MGRCAVSQRPELIPCVPETLIDPRRESFLRRVGVGWEEVHMSWFKSICFAKLLSEKTDSADKQANFISKSSQTDIKPALVNYTVWRGPTISYDGMNTNLKANNNKKPTYCDK